MMQAKENQQFNIVKENLVPNNNQINKSNALQPSKTNFNNIQNKNVQLVNKPTGLQVAKQSNENNVPIKPTGLQVSKSINQPQNSKGIQNKIQQQKENASKRQSLKPIKNEIIDGKIKKIEKPKSNSGSKLNKKNRKSNDSQKGLKKEQINKNNQQPVNQQTQQQQINKPVQQQPIAAKKENADCDFIIFCDDNDELEIKAVEKENNQMNVEQQPQQQKKKGLAERNIKAQQQPQQQNIQINLQNKTIQENVINKLTTSTSIVQQAITKIETATQVQETINIVKTNIEKELIKEAETLMSIDLSKDEEFEEITINSTIENKENDPTLMSIDQSVFNLTKEELETQINQYRDVAGDMVCREFSTEIYVYMLERELKFLPDPAYMSKQPEINTKMRAMLVDWLIDVGIEYELENETIFLTISYIDKFLSSLTISLQNFQLLGTAALFIAAKYEEIYPPELKDFIFVTDDAYTKLQMLSMEKVILKSLNFNVSPPTSLYFLKYFLTKLSLPVYVQYFAEYLCFLSLLHTDPFLSFSPSDIAISSIILALHTYTLDDVINFDEFKELTRIHFYKEKDGSISDEKAIFIRQNCVNALYKLQRDAAQDAQQAVYTKYSSEKYLSVATVELADDLPLVENFFF